MYRRPPHRPGDRLAGKSLVRPRTSRIVSGSWIIIRWLRARLKTGDRRLATNTGDTPPSGRDELPARPARPRSAAGRDRAWRVSTGGSVDGSGSRVAA